MKYGNYDINEDGNSSVTKIIQNIDNNSTVVELGSSFGYILQYLKEQKQCKVYGYELDRETVILANNNGIKTTQVNLDQIDDTFFDTFPQNIDYIICADVLEHLKNMDDIIRLLSRYLQKNPKCKLLISFPNITYYGVVDQLLKGEFKYQEVGILDRTHLRFYDRYALGKLFNENSLEVISFDTIELDPENSEFQAKMDKDVLKILEAYGSQDYLTYQFVFTLCHTQKPALFMQKNTQKKSILNEYEYKKDTEIAKLIEIIKKKDSQIIELNKLAHKQRASIELLQKDLTQFLENKSIKHKIKMLFGMYK